MESIAVTKPGMGVLSQERLLLSPFGALAQAFSQEILDRARKEEGRWSYVPLDLLEEGEESQTAPAVPPVIQVDLHLVLEALRREKGESEQRRATERIVERILQIREVRDRPAAQSPARPRLEERMPASPMGVLRQNISQTLVQENRFGPFLLAEAAAKGREASKIPPAPGTLGRQAEALAQVLQDLREGVGPAATETGRMNAVEGEARTRLPQAASVSRIMPREELRKLQYEKLRALIDNLYSGFGVSNLPITGIVVEKEATTKQYRFRSPYDNSYFEYLFGTPLFEEGHEFPYILLDGETYADAGYYIAPTALGFVMINGVGPEVNPTWNCFGSVAGNLQTSAGPIEPGDPSYPLGSFDAAKQMFDFGTCYFNIEDEGAPYYLTATGFELWLNPSLMETD